MSRRPLIFAALGMLLLVTSSANAAAAPPEIQLDRASVSARLGTSFSFSSTLRTGPAGSTGPLVAHLNVVSMDPSTYVDPEDWSSARTRYLLPLAPGTTRQIRWSVKAVNSGRFTIYVTAVPSPGSSPIAVSSPLRVDVKERRTLNSGGVLPLALAVPAMVLAIGALSRRLGSPSIGRVRRYSRSR
jgi:hypothetical protein